MAFLAADVVHNTLKHFPFAYIEPSTLRHMRQKQIHALSKSEPTLPSTVLKKIEGMQQKQHAMLKMVQKDLTHAKCYRECQNKRYCEQYVRLSVQSKRLATARAHRYFREYELQLRSKLQNARTREEQTLIKAFESGLKLQKDNQRVAEKYAKERQFLLESKVCEHVETMEKM